MKVSEVLNNAADHIERNGWWSDHHGSAMEFVRPACTANAIFREAPTDTAYYRPLFAPATDSLQKYLGVESLSGIWKWNDAPERTAGEVIETLRACALIESARESQDEAFATYAENLEAAR